MQHFTFCGFYLWVSDDLQNHLSQVFPEYFELRQVGNECMSQDLKYFRLNRALVGFVPLELYCSICGNFDVQSPVVHW